MQVSFKAKYWRPADKNRIQCDLCPRACKIKEGQRGFCFVRANNNREMALTTYGLSSGFCIDPIEKKPLNHFYPGSAVLSFGTAGCNSGCKFCQNWHISRSKETELLSEKAPPDIIGKRAKELKCKSVAFTYNDPVIFLEYAIDTAIECHKLGIKTVAVTAGFINAEPRKEFFGHIDAANVDLKSFSKDFYKKFCGTGLENVLETLVYIKKETNTWLEITTLLIPTLNDSDKEIDKLTGWIYSNLGPDLPLHFSAFHPDGEMTNLPRTPLSTLVKAREIAQKNGLCHVFTGNVSDPQSASTFCQNCGQLLIERDWYSLGKWNLTADGRCKFCNEKCSGLFDREPGTWGTNRQPVSMHY